MPMLRGSVLGFLVGVLPGGGATISTFASYGLEKRISRHPERFGTGTIEGVAAPESANNSASTGAFVPLLTLGIPSNGVIALLLGAIMLHGITPGPLLFRTRPDMFWGLITSMYIGNVMLLVLNLPLVGLFAKLVSVPSSIMTPIIAFVCLLGAYAVNNNPFDILIILTLGIFGFLAEKLDFEAPPLLLAFVLGPRIEQTLRQSLILSRGSFGIFFWRPIAAVTMVLAILLYLTPVLRAAVKMFGRRSDALPGAKGGENSSHGSGTS
jgi:putative tricarboxylic transport membrane protein